MKHKAQLYLPTYHDSDLVNNKLGPEWSAMVKCFKQAIRFNDLSAEKEVL